MANHFYREQNLANNPGLKLAIKPQVDVFKLMFDTF